MAHPQQADSTPPAPDDGSRRWPLVAVTVCCLATLAAKLLVNAPRDFVGHGDVAYYFTVARNLVAGRGFVVDYVWTYLGDPQGLPAPSNIYWMPLPSVLCALGMLLAGGGYLAAQGTMIAVSSLVPAVVYLLGRDLFGRTTGLLGAVLATTFHLFMDQLAAPLSHGPYTVLAGLGLWLVVRAGREPRWIPAVGAVVGLVQLCRSDGLLLFATLAATLLAWRRRPPLRLVAGAVLAYALVMSPWWAHNLQVHGALMPAGPARVLWMRSYPQLYALPETVTPASWLEQGAGAIAAHKVRVGRRNLAALATGMTSGAAQRKRAWSEPAVVTLMVLAWIGMLSTFRRPFVPIWTHAALEWAFYSLAFTAIGPESFRSGMYSLYPFLLAASAKGLQTLVRRLTGPVPAARRRTVAVSVTVAAVAWIVAGQLAFARRAMEVKAHEIDNVRKLYAALEENVLEPQGLTDEVLMTRNVHALHAATGQRCIQIPYADEPGIRAVARRFGARHLLIQRSAGQPAWPPALEDIDENPGFARVAGPFGMGDQVLTLYRFLD